MTLKTDIPLAEANAELAPLSAAERVQWAAERFDEGLWALTSGGIDSPVLPHVLRQAGVDVPFLHINTGVSFPETLPFLVSLAKKYDLSIHTVTSRLGELSDEEARDLFLSDPEGYRETTKLEPMRRAISELGITAILSGVRSHQTDNRANLGYIGGGKDGELRIHPILDWTDGQVEGFSQAEGLPVHPLSGEYGSLGDRINTVPAKGREGRLLGEHRECGLHLEVSTA